jgi:hypothetical protein
MVPLYHRPLPGIVGSRLSSQPTIDITPMPYACNGDNLLGLIHVIDHPIHADSQPP